MRFGSSVTSVSWIPSESVSGPIKAGFAVGMAHYDDPPPDVIEDLRSCAPPESSASPTTWRPGSR